MRTRSDRKRMNVERDRDRLSSLPDDLIHKILSLMETKDAVKTSGLSSRWRYIWTTMPCLHFTKEDFDNPSELVRHVLSARNDQIEVSSVKLSFSEEDNYVHVRDTLHYASSHNVQQLDITCWDVKKTVLPFRLFDSQSLKHLTFTGYTHLHTISAPISSMLPALATLTLHRVTLHDSAQDNAHSGFFSYFANLKNLTLKNCLLEGLNGFKICHHGLCSLTLEDGCNNVNVVTPQLKNLTIIYCIGIHVVSAPNLSSLQLKDWRYYADDDGDCLNLPTDLHHLEKVDLCIQCPFENKVYAHKIVCLLQTLHSVKYLILNLELFKFLSSFLELIIHQPSPFTNLSSLKIYPADVTKPKVTMCTEVKNWLLDRSSDVSLTMVSHEEIITMMNVTSARNLMGKLHVLLDQWKESRSVITNTTQVPMELNNFRERMACIESYWKDLNEQLEKGYKNTRRTISLLRKIKKVLKKVPKSDDRAKLQTRFSGLRVEAETIMYDVMDHPTGKLFKS